jgi:hypothetical protein
MADRALRVAASFSQSYYQTLVSDPQSVLQYYSHDGSARHTDAAAEAVGKESIKAMLARSYPEDFRGRIVVNALELKEHHQAAIKFLVRGRFFPSSQKIPQKDFSHLVELKEHENHPNVFGIARDVISWVPVPQTQVQAAAPSVSPPPVMKSWSEDTPPLFAKAPPADVSPLQQPMAPPAIPPPPLVEDPEEREDAPAPEVSKEETSESDADEPTPEPEPAKTQQAVETKPALTEADLKGLTFAERLRLKAGLPLKEEPKKAEEELKKADEKKAAKGEEKKEKKEEKAEKKGEAKEKKDSEKKETEKKAPAARTNASPAAEDDKKKGRVLSSTVVYYHLILKGLPRNTNVEELYTLLEPHVPIVKPIKLESRTDKNDSNTTRTFAFVLLDLAKLGNSASAVDQSMSLLKGKKLQLHGTNVIVDKVREKYLDKK